MPLAALHMTAQFTVDEAIALLNRIVSPRDTPDPQIEDLGVVVGVLVLNEEPEVLVKRLEHLEQCNRKEFQARFNLEREDP